MTHIFRLPSAIAHEWNEATRPGILAGCVLEVDQIEWCRIITRTAIPSADLGADGVVSAWRGREFPGCSIIAVTTDVWVAEGLRGQGTGSWLRDLRTRAYREAGFRAEMCTVRTDNARQEAIMRRRARSAVELPSDRGGSIRLWVTELGPDAGGCTEHGATGCVWCALWNREAA